MAQNKIWPAGITDDPLYDQIFLVLHDSKF